MFKNMLKRSWLSIIRKPGRAILIGLIVFAMANLVLASVAIRGAVSESVSYAKSSLGGTVYLQPDISKLRQQMQSSSTGESEGATSQPVRIERPKIPLSTVKSIADSDYVKDYTYSLNVQAKAGGLTPVSSSQSQSDMPGSGFRGGMPGGESEATQLTGDMTISGINSYAFIDAVKSGTMKISSGTYFDESTNDQAIISYDLANDNNLKVGDSIKLQNIYDSSEHDVKIIGIYDLSDTNQSFGTPENTVYMNAATAAKFLGSTNYNNGDYDVQNVHFELTSAEHSDALITAAKSKVPSLETDNLTLSIDTSAYEQMVGPIESVGKFATTIFWVVVIASIAIITLIVTINVKDRRYEMGVLLSLGASKMNVTMQIIVELVVIGTVALAVAAATGTLVARAMSQSLLESQIAMSKQESEQNFGRPTTGTGGMRGGMMRMGGPGQQSRSNVKAIDSINVNASASDYLMLFATSYGIIILALFLPAWSIIKYQPKTILTGKE